MYFSKIVFTSALLGLASATNHMGEMAPGGLATSSTSAIAASETLSSSAVAAVPAASSAPVAEAGVATHVVQVGGPNGSLIFTPDNLQAKVGDLVQFQFYPKAHSVVQSTFDQPCVPMQNVMPNVTNAFFSGFMPTNVTFGQTKNRLTYTIRVMDTKPIWYYCSQAKHCQGGMVGAINAVSSGNKTVSAFRQLAASAPENLSPGQAAGSGSSGSGSGSGSSSGSGSGSGSGSSESGAGGAGAGAGGAGGAGTGAGAGANPTDTASSAPAEQTNNPAPSTFGSPSYFGLALGAVVAAVML